MVSGLATHATWARAFRPSCLPISAKVDLSESDKRNRAGKCARKTRFSAAKYSFCRNSSWFTRRVTYASRRIHLVSFIWNGQPRLFNCSEFFDGTGTERGGDHHKEVTGHHDLGMVADEAQPALFRIGYAHWPVLARKVPGRVPVLSGASYAELARRQAASPMQAAVRAAGVGPTIQNVTRRTAWPNRGLAPTPLMVAM